MNEDVITDLKQFIVATVSQQAVSLRIDLTEAFDAKINGLDKKLSGKIDDLSASVADALEAATESNEARLTNHEVRITRLEHTARAGTG